MHTRKNALDQWLIEILGNNSFKLNPLTGDASFRQYARLTHDGLSYILMDAPPQQEKLTEFIHVQQIMVQQNLPVPQIFHQNLTQGFLLLDDLGDEWLLSQLTSENANKFYQSAMQLILHMQQCSSESLPVFDSTHIRNELNLFPEWFIHKYLKITLTPKEQALIDAVFDNLTLKITQQPYRFIHRDFHSRNLMVLQNNQLGIIDFQDAMHGPITYDLVSLLKDCYIQWPQESIRAWVNDFYQQLPTSQPITEQQFFHDFEYCGLQRHLKVLGVFARLYLRDKKPGYLKDLPLTLNYVISYLEKQPNHSEFYEFFDWMRARVYPQFLKIHQTHLEPI